MVSVKTIAFAPSRQKRCSRKKFSNNSAWEKFRAGSLLDRGPLSLTEREIVIDRTSALTGCEYEWSVHVATFAAAAHLSDEQVRATALGKADAACWSTAEQALIAAAVIASEAKQSMLPLRYDCFACNDRGA